MILTDVQWQLVQPLLPPAPPPGQRGRPALDQRLVLDGILWKLSTRYPWESIPRRFGAYQTCFLYYRRWKKSGVLSRVINTLLRDVKVRGRLDINDFMRRRVKFETRGRQVIVYIPARDIHSWQLATAIIYYQYIAYDIEKQKGIARRTDPLEGIFTPQSE